MILEIHRPNSPMALVGALEHKQGNNYRNLNENVLGEGYYYSDGRRHCNANNENLDYAAYTTMSCQIQREQFLAVKSIVRGIRREPLTLCFMI